MNNEKIAEEVRVEVGVISLLPVVFQVLQVALATMTKVYVKKEGFLSTRTREQYQTTMSTLYILKANTCIYARDHSYGREEVKEPQIEDNHSGIHRISFP